MSAPQWFQRHVSSCSAGNRANTGPRFLVPSRRIGVEAAIEGDWARWLGDDGEFVGMTGFGASAPAETLYREFGMRERCGAPTVRARGDGVELHSKLRESGSPRASI